MAGKGRGVTAKYIGQHFGRWTVISRAGSTSGGRATWNCKCDCGNDGVVDTPSLKRGDSKSCGCLLSEETTKRNIERGEKRRAARYINKKGFLRNQIRKIFHKWPAYWETIKEARVERGKYLCKGYGKEAHIIGAKGFNIDHIDPIGPLEDWNIWLERLFCDKDNLQLLCKDCHSKKTKDEREQLKGKRNARRS